MTSILKVSEIQDPTNGNSALTVDTSGRILTPANPKFSLYLATGPTGNYTSNSNVPFDTIDFNIGNCVALSSNVATFTAPITGYYQFNLMVSFGNINAASYYSTYLVKSGVATSNETYRFIESPASGVYQTGSTAQLIYVTANQTLNPIIAILGDTSVQIRPGTRFNGFLVG
jgi:hypothetical protein